MMKGKKLSVGVIGLGRISPRHIDDSINNIPDLELAAVCDIDLKKVKETSKKYHVPYYKKYQELISDKNVDIVSICTPNGLHLPMGLEVARAKKHCVMEKPIALNYPDGKRLVAAFRRVGTEMIPVLQVRYNPAVQVLKTYIDQHALGKIYTATLIVRWTRPQEYFAQSKWRGTKKMDGGSLLSQAIHYIDTMQFVLGKAKKIYAKVGRVAHDIEVEDIAHAIIDLNNKIRVLVEFTICTYPHNLECSLAVMGEKGTIKIGGTAMNVCEIWEVKDSPQPVIPESLTPNQYAGGLYVGSCPNHIAIYKALVDKLVYHKNISLDANDALESLRIIDGIKESSRKNKEITISL